MIIFFSKFYFYKNILAVSACSGPGAVNTPHARSPDVSSAEMISGDNLGINNTNNTNTSQEDSVLIRSKNYLINISYI